MSSVWDDFYKLSELKQSFKNLDTNSAKVYANGRNLIEVLISVMILDENGIELKLTEDDLRDKVYLCDYETSQPLESIWTVGDDANEFTRSFQGSSNNKVMSSQRINKNTAYVSKYLSCTERDSVKILAVGINIPGVGNFETTRKGTNTKNGPHGETGSIFKTPSSLTIYAIPEITYNENDLKITKAFERNRKNNSVYYHFVGARGHRRSATKTYATHYDNYYITVANGIKRVNFHSYDYSWIVNFDSEHNNQHMIVVHPFNTGEKTEKFGFERSLEWGFFDEDGGKFDLTQEVTYNDRPNQLCISQLYFECGSAWRLPDNVGFGAFTFNTWFDLYDIYGNHGKFKPVFSDDHKWIEIKLA